MARPRTPTVPIVPGLVVAQNGTNAPRRAIVAAGAAIQLDDEKTIRAWRRRVKSWQQRAWLYNDRVPEIGFAHDYVRDSLSRVRLFAGTRPEPDQDPEPLPDGALNDACTKILARLEPHSEMFGAVALNLDVTGDVSIAIVPDADEPDGERCRVLSVDQLRTKNDKWFIFRNEEDNTGVELEESAVVFRLWTPHGRFSDDATSPMLRLDMVCEELLVLTQMMMGIARSRLAVSGVFAIADEFTLSAASGDDDGEPSDAGDGEGRGDPFVEDWMIAAAAAMSDPMSAAAAMPIVVRGPLDMIERGLKFIQIARPFDPVAAEQRQELLGRVANGINLPREITLGMGSTNHWNDRQIDDQTWRVHLEPRTQRQCAGITDAYLRPALLAEGVTFEVARTVEVWYDPVALFAQPDPSLHTLEAHTAILISDETARRTLGFDESDAPDEEELAARHARAVALTPAPFGAPAGPPGGTGDATADEDVAPASAVAASGSVVAAARSGHRLRSHDRLGRALVAIERDTRTRLQAEANAALLRALERAGNKLRAKMQRNPNSDRLRKLQVEVAALPALAIASHLGRAQIAALGLNSDELIGSVVGDLEGRYTKLVTRAQHAAIDAAARETQRTVDAEARDEFDEGQQEDRHEGWLLLAAGLTALAHEQLFSPAPAAPPVGEFDDTVQVPTGLVRAALDRSGGAQVATPTPTAPRALESTSPGPGGPPDGGGATAGPDVLKLFREHLGIIADAYTWVYGDAPRTREFEPHRNLDGETFDSWDADVLANISGFPDVAFYRPGDHLGCQCDFAPTFTQASIEE